MFGIDIQLLGGAAL